MKKYYVYLLLDLRKPGNYQYDKYFFNFEPFYVGISSRKDRFTEHLNPVKKNENIMKFSIIQKIKNVNFNLKKMMFIFEYDLNAL
jgi:hypothetical protein